MDGELNELIENLVFADQQAKANRGGLNFEQC